MNIVWNCLTLLLHYLFDVAVLFSILWIIGIPALSAIIIASIAAWAYTELHDWMYFRKFGVKTYE